MKTLKTAGFLLILTALVSMTGYALQRDPVKETQTDAVPVTEELLKQESESGPASPSFKMMDTSKFFVKKPYEDMRHSELFDTELVQDVGFSSDDWSSWFDETSVESKMTEPLDEQELKK